MASQPRYHFVPGTTGPTIVGGDGCWLITDDGRRILDAAGGAMVVNIGHGRTVVADAVRDALDGGAYVVPIWSTPHRERLHDVLAERWLPDRDGQRVLHQRWQRVGGLGRAPGPGAPRRGGPAGAVEGGRPPSRATTASRWERWPSAATAPGVAGYEPLLLDMPKVPWDDADAVVATIEREDPATIAAFLFEPITGAAGACLMADDEYWLAVEEVCRRHDILLVADEVMTGFGRTGRRWGYEHLPIRPDVLYGGKGLGGGYVPIGMVAATDDVVAPLRGSRFMYFTFTANDGACAGAAAVLEVLEAEHLVERAASMGDVLERSLPPMPSATTRHVVEPARPRLVPWHRADAQRRATDGGGRRRVPRPRHVDLPGRLRPVEDAVMIGCPLTISDGRGRRSSSTRCASPSTPSMR